MGLADEIERLVGLKNSGALSVEEFNRAKAKLLNAENPRKRRGLGSMFTVFSILVLTGFCCAFCMDDVLRSRTFALLAKVVDKKTWMEADITERLSGEWRDKFTGDVYKFTTNGDSVQLDQTNGAGEKIVRQYAAGSKTKEFIVLNTTDKGSKKWLKVWFKQDNLLLNFFDDFTPRGKASVIADISRTKEADPSPQSVGVSPPRPNSPALAPERDVLVVENCMGCMGRGTVEKMCMGCFGRGRNDLSSYANPFTETDSDRADRHRREICTSCSGRGKTDGRCGVCFGSGKVQKYVPPRRPPQGEDGPVFPGLAQSPGGQTWFCTHSHALRRNAVLDAPRPLPSDRAAEQTTQSLEDGIPARSVGTRKTLRQIRGGVQREVS